MKKFLTFGFMLFILSACGLLTDEAPDLEPSTENTHLGFVEGSLSYPSHSIPPMEVCAENIETGESVCTKEHIIGEEYYYGEGYQIKNIPPGDYHVVAYLLEEAPGEVYQASYSEHVICMASGNVSPTECSNHERIVLSVAEGDYIQGINPWDWGN